jgi:hypothetical protein
MIIKVLYDTSVTSLSQTMQAQIETAVNAAVAYYEHVFTNPITFTINFSWGYLTREDPNNPGQRIQVPLNSSTPNLGGGNYYFPTPDNPTGLANLRFPYAQIYSWYQNYRDTADNYSANIPPSDPTSGGLFQLSPVQMEAWGLADNTGLDNVNYIGLNSSWQWSFDPSNRSTTPNGSPANDAIGEIEHEISELMGRYQGLSQTFGPNVYTPLDLFRYSSPGVRQLQAVGSLEGYFSIDGQTLLKQYNGPTRPNEDFADWFTNTNAGGDSYGDSWPGFINPVSLTDLREMNVIGWRRALTTVDDFNGDGVSDIMVWNDTTGQFGAYSMQGSPDGFLGIAGADPAYTAVGVGDFLGGINSQRVDDVLFRNNSTGDTYYYHENADRIAQGWHHIGGSDTRYSVVGIGDFFSSVSFPGVPATSDILYRDNSTGDTWIAVMNQSLFGGWLPLGGSDTHYAVVGVGDFYGPDGDGTSDILYRNNSTGDVWFEAISNGAPAGANPWHPLGGSDTHYAVVGVGDFYGNGTDDILYRNNSTGDMWIDAISNGAQAGALPWHPLGGSNTNYAVVATGDYYGNGTSDILFRNNATADTWYEAISNGAPAFSIFSPTESPWHQVVLPYDSPTFKVVA